MTRREFFKRLPHICVAAVTSAPEPVSSVDNINCLSNILSIKSHIFNGRIYHTIYFDDCLEFKSNEDDNYSVIVLDTGKSTAKYI